MLVEKLNIFLNLSFVVCLLVRNNWFVLADPNARCCLVAGIVYVLIYVEEDLVCCEDDWLSEM